MRTCRNQISVKKDVDQNEGLAQWIQSRHSIKHNRDTQENGGNHEWPAQEKHGVHKTDLSRYLED